MVYSDDDDDDSHVWRLHAGLGLQVAVSPGGRTAIKRQPAGDLAAMVRSVCRGIAIVACIVALASCNRMPPRPRPLWRVIADDSSLNFVGWVSKDQLVFTTGGQAESGAPGRKAQLLVVGTDGSIIYRRSIAGRVCVRPAYQQIWVVHGQGQCDIVQSPGFATSRAVLPVEAQGDPVWSRTGNEFALRTGPSRVVIGVLEKSRFQLKTVQTSQDPTALQWCPDGRHLACIESTASDKLSQVEIVNATSTQTLEVRATLAKLALSSNIWRDDVSYFIHREQTPDALILCTIGGSQRVLVQSQTPLWGSSWNPAGTVVAGTRDWKGKRVAFIWSSVAQTVISGELQDGTARLAWSPDGESLAALGPKKYYVCTEAGRIVRLVRSIGGSRSRHP